MQGPDIAKLLDAAKKITKSDYATGKTTGIPRTSISDYRAGRRQMPPADVALVADVAGLDAVAWCARAVAQAHEGTEKGAALREALKKALQATGGVMLIVGTASDVLASQLIRCALGQVPKLRYVVHARLTREASRSGIRGVNRNREWSTLG